MTTSTTVLALMPLALGTAEGSEIQAPLARVVVGGLVTSTVVTLLLVPCVYLLVERRIGISQPPAAHAAISKPAERAIGAAAE
jgi:HAE1 family hydrophobic/amphiphilic exporter-1